MLCGIFYTKRKLIIISISSCKKIPKYLYITYQTYIEQILNQLKINFKNNMYTFIYLCISMQVRKTEFSEYIFYYCVLLAYLLTYVLITFKVESRRIHFSLAMFNQLKNKHAQGCYLQHFCRVYASFLLKLHLNSHR